MSELICDNFFLLDLVAEKLEWGDSDQINAIMQRYPEGFDLVLGADIYILFFFVYRCVFIKLKTYDGCE